MSINAQRLCSVPPKLPQHARAPQRKGKHVKFLPLEQFRETDAGVGQRHHRERPQLREFAEDEF